MKWVLRIIPVCAVLAFTPAYAAEPDQHADHHPAPAAPLSPDAKAPPVQGCPMMDGKMMGGQMMTGQMKKPGDAPGSAAPGTGSGGMMMGKGPAGSAGMMTCPQGQAGAAGTTDQGGGDGHAQHHPAPN